MTPEYHIQSIRSALVREALGGIAAADSTLLARAVVGLLELGWTSDEIKAAIDKQVAELHAHQ